MRFFGLNRVADPDRLADEAMDRLARRVATPDREDIGSPQAFALGIARHLLQEETRKQIRENEVALEWTSLHAGHDEDHEVLLQALDHCLSRMREDQQELLRTYYQSTGREKIEHHRKLAPGQYVENSAHKMDRMSLAFQSPLPASLEDL